MSNLKILNIKPSGGTALNVVLDSVEAFIDLGCEVETVEFTKGENWEDNLRDRILRFGPDFVYTINNIGVITKLHVEAVIPYVSWFIDDPFLWWLGEERMEDAVSSYCVLFVCDRTHIDRLKKIGFEYIYYLPFATNPRIFKPIELTDQERERFGCNISFAGSSINSGDFQKWYRWAEDIAKRHSEGKTIMDEAAELKSQNYILEISDILNEIQNSLDSFIPFKGEGECKAFLDVVEHKANSIYRKKIIEAVRDFGLYLYGDEGWVAAPPGAGTSIGVNFFGSLDNRTELPKLYNASKINLNMTQSQTPTSPPIRPFDVAGCGGFLLSDYRRDLGEFFEIEKEIVCYRDKDDLCKKVVYYLDHPQERQEIGEKARQRALKDHTYKKRMGNVIEIMGMTFLKN